MDQNQAQDQQANAVSQAAAEAATAATNLEKADKDPTVDQAARQRRNFFFVHVKFKDGTQHVSIGLKNAGEINQWVSSLGEAPEEVRVIYGHERRVTAKHSTKLVLG